MSTLPILDAAYRLDPDKPHREQLVEVLMLFGIDSEDLVPIDEDGYVDLQELVDQLPPKLGGELNVAHKELYEYLQAIPPKRRRLGVIVHAEHVISLLMERLEFFEGLSRSLVRLCAGRECPHYAVCPFKQIVDTTTKADAIPCAVEREVIRNAVESFVQPQNGQKPKVDPRRPEMGLLFKQLVQLLVKQVRISMYLQIHDILIDQWEILKDGDMERFDTHNQTIHPLADAWDKNHAAIQKLMQSMGLSVEFQIKQGLWIDESSQFDAEQRGIEMAMVYLRDAFKKRAEELPAGSAQREMVLEAVEHAQGELARLTGGTT